MKRLLLFLFLFFIYTQGLFSGIITQIENKGYSPVKITLLQKKTLTHINHEEEDDEEEEVEGEYQKEEPVEIKTYYLAPHKTYDYKIPIPIKDPIYEGFFDTISNEKYYLKIEQFISPPEHFIYPRYGMVTQPKKITSYLLQASDDAIGAHGMWLQYPKQNQSFQFPNQHVLLFRYPGALDIFRYEENYTKFFNETYKMTIFDRKHPNYSDSQYFISLEVLTKPHSFPNDN